MPHHNRSRRAGYFSIDQRDEGMDDQRSRAIGLALLVRPEELYELFDPLSIPLFRVRFVTISSLRQLWRSWQTSAVAGAASGIIGGISSANAQAQAAENARVMAAYNSQIAQQK